MKKTAFPLEEKKQSLSLKDLANMFGGALNGK